MPTSEDPQPKSRKVDQATKERNAWESVISLAETYAIALDKGELPKSHGEKLLAAISEYKAIHTMRLKNFKS